MDKIRVVLTDEDFEKFRQGIDIIEKKVGNKIIEIEFEGWV
jgi:hypothetical protein